MAKKPTPPVYGKPSSPKLTKKPSILIAIGAPKIAPMPKGKSKKSGY